MQQVLTTTRRRDQVDAWRLYGLGFVVFSLLFLAVSSFGNEEQDDPETRPYQWGDELHEYSYRHPWDDETW